MASTKWGILGAGAISNDFVNAIYALDNNSSHEVSPYGIEIIKKVTHLWHFSKCSHIQVVAVAARNLSRAQEFAKKFDIPKAYDNYEDLAKDQSLDIIYVATICRSHLEVCKMLLDHGKNVLCEMPLALDVKQTQEILDYAKERKRFFMEGMCTWFLPVYKKLKQEIESGTIGKVCNVISDFGFKVEGINSEKLARKDTNINEAMICW